MAGNAYQAAFENADGTIARLEGEIQYTDGTNQPASNVNPVTSGSLSTSTFTSTTAAQVSTTRTVTCYVPWSGDGTNNAATLKVELSPDNNTFSTLTTLSLAQAVNNTGAITLLLTLVVPAGWYVKLTTTHTTLGTATYV